LISAHGGFSPDSKVLAKVPLTLRLAGGRAKSQLKYLGSGRHALGLPMHATKLAMTHIVCTLVYCARAI
jgi:hypothetical protein